MTTLEGIAANLRAVLASHVSLQLVDGRGLGPSHNVERNGLVRVAAETADFEIEVASIERIAERRRRLRGAAIPKHALVPRFAGKAVGFPAGSGGFLSRGPRPKMVSRDLVPMAEECTSLAGIAKPLELAAGRETDATARASSADASVESDDNPCNHCGTQLRTKDRLTCEWTRRKMRSPELQ